MLSIALKNPGTISAASSIYRKKDYVEMSSRSTLIMEKPFRKVVDSFWTVLTSKVDLKGN